MSTGKWLGRWFKVYDNFDEIDENGKAKFWTGNIDNDELGAWLRLIAKASRSKPKGIIQVETGIPYTSEQLNHLIKTDKKYIEKWIKQGAIKSEKGIIYIMNWKFWQNEQDRKDSYKDSPNRHPKQTTNKPQLDVDVDVELDLDVKKTLKTKTPPTYVDGLTLIDLFKKIYLEQKGVEYIPKYARDGSSLKRIYSAVKDDFKNLLLNYFKLTDPWLFKHAFDVPRFEEKINFLRTRAIKPVDPDVELPLVLVQEGDKYYFCNYRVNGDKVQVLKEKWLLEKKSQEEGY